jgi:hypothetical protein
VARPMPADDFAAFLTDGDDGSERRYA